MGEVLIPETVLAYAAGIIDGEGYIGIRTLNKKGKKEARYIYHTLEVQVSNSIESMIDYLQTNFGGLKGQGHRPNRKPYYRWTITSRKADKFLRKIYPYLVAKRDQADVAFQFRETFRKGRPNPISTDDLEVRAECYLELRNLKRAA